MKLLYGKPIADSILLRLKNDIERESIKPGLAVFLIGNDKASRIYVSLKEKKAREIGINFFRFDLPVSIRQEEIIERIEKLNHDILVNGIIVQFPLPEGFDNEKIIAAMDSKRDVDGFHPANTSKFLQGSDVVWPVFPRAIVRLLESSGEQLDGKRAIVISNSDEFGKIMCAALERLGTLAQYVLSSDIVHKLNLIKTADIIVSAIGTPGILEGGMFKNGVIIVDGGIEKVGDKVLGDVDFASVEALSGFITPVPGGVGPLTIACLLENTFLAFKAQQKEEKN